MFYIIRLYIQLLFQRPATVATLNAFRWKVEQLNIRLLMADRRDDDRHRIALCVTFFAFFLSEQF
jgi:hypothetical protein